MRALAILVVLTACHHGRVAPPANTAREGIAIALYDPGTGDGYAVVDDRRWIDVTGDRLLIDRIDPGAALPSLVIEPLGDDRLAVGACTRERVVPADKPAAASPAKPVAFAPVIECAVHGKPGRYLVRVLYVSTKLAYHAEHEVIVREQALGADGAVRASVASRFAIATPPWHARADVVLYDGMPGGEQPASEVARGTIVLDGSIAVLGATPHETQAELRWIYDGAARTNADVPPQDQMWGRESHGYVWVWLELGATRLAAGPIHAHVELRGATARDIDVPAAGRNQTATGLHLPLWVDDQLRGKRERWIEAAYGAALTDRFVISVANLGETPRDVWIEERLRPARRHTVGRSWPGRPAIGKEAVRTKVTVAAGAIERVGFAIDYEF